MMRLVYDIIGTTALAIYACLFCFSLACGPGGGSRRNRLREHHIKGNRMPNVPEHSAAASGPFTGALDRDDPSLSQILETDIIFQDKTYNADARKSIKTCSDSLIKLATVVKSYWSDKYKLYVMEGFVSHSESAHFKHGKRSLHYSGRAFDISLTNSPTNKDKNPFTRLGDVVPKHTLRSLAALAYYNAKFTFVKIEKNHLHVSCDTSPHSTQNSRCFSSTSFVRNQAGKSIKMKNVQIGDRVLTIDSNGQPKYSEVIMMLHKNPTLLVDDYIKVVTDKDKALVLSSYHLIYTVKKSEFIFTKDLKVNQSVKVYDAHKNSFNIVRVKNIQHVSGQGAYAPLTKEGTIVVDDIYTSCYALFPSHSISHSVFSLWRAIYPYLSKSSDLMKTDEYHWYADIFRRTINYLNIFPYSL